jgi:hypothetical protein
MIDRIREQVRNPWVAAALGFVLGLIIGLPILGWGLFPVQWVNAEPKDLRPDLQTQYLCMTIDSFIKNQDTTLAQARYQSLGDTEGQVLAGLDPMACNLTEGEVFQFRAAIAQPAVPLPGTEPQVTQPPAEATLPPAVEPTEEGEGGGVRTGLIVGLCVLMLVVGGAALYLLVFRNRKPGVPAGGGMAQYNRQEQRTEYAEGQEPPVAQYMTTYMAGDDLYDDSFSIDSPSGEFLGECGVGIADTIGVGDPKKVTAFEVWLFDKNDIQTVTKVLMSEHAYNDPQIRAKLASKGEPVLIESGKNILLETATLQLQARVVDLNYGQGALPEHSFFERLTLELAVWPKTEA